MILHIFRRLTFLMSALAVQVVSLATPTIAPIASADSAGYIGIGDDSIYRMRVQYSNQCLSETQGICTNWTLDTYDATLTSYQATQSIVLEPGYSTVVGASLTLQIISAGVPQAGNLTGTPDVSMNWIQSSVFDQNGTLIGDSRNYFDNGGLATQSQNKVFYRSNPTTVITQVFATQAVKDAYGRDAASSLPAPINYADFSYRSNFLQHNGSGAVYSHQNFDVYNNGTTTTDKTNTPDPIWDATSGLQPVGTLAWYYSAQNTWEPYTPVTNYPYTRQTWYQDGTGNPKKSAGLGDPLRMGQGHEAGNFVSPVADELDFYLQVRNQLFSGGQLGALPANLQTQATQTITHDANGVEQVMIKDAGGNTLMTARQGTGLTVNNSVTLNGAGSGAQNVGYFKLLAASVVTISGNAFTLEDMNAEQNLSFSSGSSLPAGFYKLTNTGLVSFTFTYSNSYTDVAYNFYDQKGQLAVTIAPNGTKQLYGTPGLSSFASLSAVPYLSQYTYDLQGRMVASEDADGGTHQFIYRKDGKIRFSQNAVQAAAGSYGYINYDANGRPVESGQYDGSGVGWNSAGMTSILETTAIGGGLTTGTKTDVSTTQYDVVDGSYASNTGSSNLAGYVQDAFYLNGQVSVTRRYSSIVNNSPSSTNLVSATWYAYDEEGKVIWQINYLNGLGNGVADANSYKTTDFTYDPLDNLTKKVFQAGVASETFVHYYDYDPVNKQLWHVYTNTVNNPSPQAGMLQATYYYYLHGGLKRVELASGLQGIDYTYTLEGQLKAINNSNNSSNAQDPGGDGAGNGFTADAYGEVLDYYTGDYTNGRSNIASIVGVNSSAVPAFTTGGAGDSYGGNIKAMSWFSQKTGIPGAPSNAPTAYVYQYDSKYQFANSIFGTGLNFGNSPATYTPTTNNQETVGNTSGAIAPYDGNGNIQYLQRTGTTGAVIDQFSYQYGAGNNQLATVTNVANSQPFATYQYDANGQVSVQTRTGSNPIYLGYDASGKLTGVYTDQQHTLPTVTFVYNEYGARVKKVQYNTTTNQPLFVTYYVGDVIYTQAVGSGGAVVVQEYQINGKSRIGIYSPQGPTYAYELTDHLGSDRVVVTLNTGTMQIKSFSDYYPFGELFQGSAGERYGYQGQNAETDPETGWNAFQLRMYDSRIGRWLQYDPKGHYFSPYIGMNNDPVLNTDPDGGDPSTDVVENSDGSYSIVKVDPYDGDNNIYVDDNLGNRTGQIIGRSPTPWSYAVTNDADGTYIKNPNGTVLAAELDFRLEDLQDGDAIYDHYTQAWQATVRKINYAPAALAVLALRSRNTGPYDLKSHPEYNGNIYTPVKFNGKIAPIREESDVIFGNNMRSVYNLSPMPSSTSAIDFYKAVMPVVGAYNQHQNKGNGYNAGFPFYGEHTYSGSAIYLGYWGMEYNEPLDLN